MPPPQHTHHCFFLHYVQKELPEESRLGLGRTLKLKVQLGGTGPAGTRATETRNRSHTWVWPKERSETNFFHLPPQTITHPHTAHTTHTCTQHILSRATFPPHHEGFSHNAVNFNTFRSHFPPYIIEAGWRDSAHVNTGNHRKTLRPPNQSPRSQTETQVGIMAYRTANPIDPDLD